MIYIKAVFTAVFGGLAAVMPFSATYITDFIDRLFGGAAGEYHFYLSMIFFGAATAILLTNYRILFDVLFFNSRKRKGQIDIKKITPFTKRDLFFSLIPFIFLFFPIGKGVFLFNLGDLFLEKRFTLIEGLGMLLSGGLFFAALAVSLKRKRFVKINQKSSLLIGISNALCSILPGLSRTGIAYSVGVLQGQRAQKALQFSYISALPILIVGGFCHIISATATSIAVSGGALFLTYLLSVVSASFGITVFSILAGSKNSRIFAFVNFACGVIGVIFGVIQFIVK